MKKLYKTIGSHPPAYARGLPAEGVKKLKGKKIRGLVGLFLLMSLVFFIAFDLKSDIASFNGETGFFILNGDDVEKSRAVKSAREQYKEIDYSFYFPLEAKELIKQSYLEDLPKETAVCMRGTVHNSDSYIQISSVEKANIVSSNETQVISNCPLKTIFNAHSHPYAAKRYCQPSFPTDYYSMVNNEYQIIGIICGDDDITLYIYDIIGKLLHKEVLG